MGYSEKCLNVCVLCKIANLLMNVICKESLISCELEQKCRV